MGIFSKSNNTLQVETTLRHFDNLAKLQEANDNVIKNLEKYCEEWQKMYWKAARELAELKGEVYVPDWREGQE